MSDTPLRQLADMTAAMNELEAILNEFNTDKSTDADAKIAYTTAQLNAYILAEMLDLIDNNIAYPELKGMVDVDALKADAIDRFGKGGIDE